MKESEIQKQCIDYLKAHGFFVWRNHVQRVKISGGSANNPAKGSPDIFAIKQGTFYAIEVKTPIGKVSQIQRTWLQTAKDHGAVSMVVRSIEELIQFLDLFRDNPNCLQNFPFEILN